MKQSTGLATASLVLGIASFFCNPLYLFGIAAIILGIIALCCGQPAGRSITGLVLGICGIAVQVILDLILSVFTMGMSFFF